MRLRITKSSALMLILAILAAIAVIAPASAEAHTVTRHDCAAYARHHPPYKPAFVKCMDWAAAHNVCQGVKHCKGWLLVAICESGDHVRSLTAHNIASIQWRIHNSYEGGMQFSSSSWDATHSGYSAGYLAPASVQVRSAERWRHMIGGKPQQSAGWPICGAWWY